MWDDTPESEATARRCSYDHFVEYKMRARENACFYVVADQAGRAGYVDVYPKDSPNQPHHAGGAMIIDPDAQVVAATQTEAIKDEMVTATLDSADLSHARAQPNYTLRTRRPDLFARLV